MVVNMELIFTKAICMVALTFDWHTLTPVELAKFTKIFTTMDNNVSELFPKNSESSCLKQFYFTFLASKKILSAVSISYSAKDYFYKCAQDLLSIFFGQPSHPLFCWSVDTIWRHQIHYYGTSDILSHNPLGLVMEYHPYSDQPAVELSYRMSLWKGAELLQNAEDSYYSKRALPDAVALSKDTIVAFGNTSDSQNLPPLLFLSKSTHARHETYNWKKISVQKPFQLIDKYCEDICNKAFGTHRVPEGKEAEFIDSVISVITSKYRAIPGNEGKKIIDHVGGMTLMRELQTSLGVRWIKSPTLLQYAEHCLNLLEAAPTNSRLSIPSEPVLDWSDPMCCEAKSFLDFDIYYNWADEWFNNIFVAKQRFLKLALHSEEAASAIKLDGKDIIQQNDFVELLFRLSPSGSALHDVAVMKFVLTNRPDLLKREHLTERRTFVGLFHPKDDGALLNFNVLMKCMARERPWLLSGWQAELLLKRYMEDATDLKIPLQKRVEGIQCMMRLPNISVHDVASFLTTTSLEQRIMEAVLMVRVLGF
jgi:hypothetical protein